MTGRPDGRLPDPAGAQGQVRHLFHIRHLWTVSQATRHSKQRRRCAELAGTQNTCVQEKTTLTTTGSHSRLRGSWLRLADSRTACCSAGRPNCSSARLASCSAGCRAMGTLKGSATSVSLQRLSGLALSLAVGSPESSPPFTRSMLKHFCDGSGGRDPRAVHRLGLPADRAAEAARAQADAQARAHVGHAELGALCRVLW